MEVGGVVGGCLFISPSESEIPRKLTFIGYQKGIKFKKIRKLFVDVASLCKLCLFIFGKLCVSPLYVMTYYGVISGFPNSDKTIY